MGGGYSPSNSSAAAATTGDFSLGQGVNIGGFNVPQKPGTLTGTQMLIGLGILLAAVVYLKK